MDVKECELEGEMEGEREMGTYHLGLAYLDGVLELDEGVLLRRAAREEAVGRGGRDAQVVVAGLDAGRGPRAQGERGRGREGDGGRGEHVQADVAAAASP